MGAGRWIALAVAVLVASGGLGQSGALPVKVHRDIASFTGTDEVVAQTGGAQYFLYSAHKEGGRPWADAIFVRQTGDGRTYLSRAYDCARGTWRWMGEHGDITKISQSVGSIEQIQPRAVEPGTVEYQLARYACAL